MEFEHILVDWSGEFATVTMNRPQRRNALSLAHMRELIDAFTQVGASDALGVVLAGNGPVFSAGHDFADVADADLAAVRSLLQTCTELMTLMQQIPQPVAARVRHRGNGGDQSVARRARGDAGLPRQARAAVAAPPTGLTVAVSRRAAGTIRRPSHRRAAARPRTGP